MATPRVIAELRCTSEADAQLVLDALALRLVGVSVEANRTGIAGEASLFLAVQDTRFSLAADASAFYRDVQTAWLTGSVALLIGVESRVSQHSCPHNGGENWYHCRDDPSAGYVEAVK